MVWKEFLDSYKLSDLEIYNVFNEDELNSIVTEKQFNILKKYLIDKRIYSDIAKEFNVTHQAIYWQYINAIKKLKIKYYEKVTGNKLTCKIKGCFNNVYCKELCHKHYWRQQRDIKNNRTRTRFDRNEIIIYEDKNYAEVLLYDKKEKIIAKTIIDIQAVERVKNYKMSLAHGYVTIRIDKNKIELSNFLYNKEIPKDHCLSYVNENKLDNRKSNLILKKREDLNRNEKQFKSNTSGCRGVYKINQKGEWTGLYSAYIAKEYLGTFNDFERAVKARKTAEKQRGWIKTFEEKYIQKFKDEYIRICKLLNKENITSKEYDEYENYINRKTLLSKLNMTYADLVKMAGFKAIKKKYKDQELIELDKKILKLRLKDELSYVDIGIKLDISNMTVKRRIEKMHLTEEEKLELQKVEETLKHKSKR